MAARPTLSSSILRGALFEPAPLVIDNAFELDLPAEDLNATDDLLETLRHEHPDAEPEDIEDALQEAIDTLMGSPDTGQPPDDSDLPGSLDSEDPWQAQPEASSEEPGAASQVELAEELPAVGPSAAQLLDEAHRSAAEVLAGAHAEAAGILAEADGRAAEIERAAYEKGYEEGLTAGGAAGEEQSAQTLAQVVAIVDRATALHDTMLHEAEGEMVALCLEIARKILQAELRSNPDIVKSVLASAVQKINGAPRVTIKVHPSQVETVRKHWLEAYGSGYREKEWSIEGDANVFPGGCLLETKYGQLDAQIGSQFAEIQKTFALLLGS